MRIGRMMGTALALGWAMPAAADWQEASSPHFVVYSDDTPAGVRDFTTRLERYDHAMRSLRGQDDRRASRASRVTVFVVRNVSAVERLTGAANIAGVYFPRASGSVIFTPRTSGDGSQTALTAQQVLLHEYAHHLTFLTWGDKVLPPWFVEGFAEFNATATFGADGSMTFGLPPYYRARTMLDLNAVPLKMLLTADPNYLMPGQREVFYGRAWMLVHYLTFDGARRQQLSDYLGRINKGVPAMEAAKVFGDTDKLDVELNRYARRRKIETLTLRAADLAAGTVVVRALSPGEAATMPARLMSSRGVAGRTAATALAAARIAAGDFPADAATQNELAEAAFDAGDYAGAQAAAASALAIDGKSIHALMYQGLARAAAATKAGDTDAAHWQAIRRWFGVANRVDPEDPWPLAMFYQSYAMAKQTPTTNAEDGLLYARALAPFDGSLGLNAASVYLHRGKPEQAMEALTPVASDPHGGYPAALARSAMSAMKTDGSTEAAKILADGKVRTADLADAARAGRGK